MLSLHTLSQSFRDPLRVFSACAGAQQQEFLSTQAGDQIVVRDMVAQMRGHLRDHGVAGHVPEAGGGTPGGVSSATDAGAA